MSGFWPGCCCGGCSGHVHRIATDGTIVWNASWDSRYPTFGFLSSLGTYALLSTNDGTNVYAIGTRCSSSTTNPQSQSHVRSSGRR